ncbi:PQQ-binding-like beta-propeller repeat protein [Burkholderia plantarii]|uniref:outer membrane protein assembly factor BamB family protein n=1 Tax=Burkholderia plantarii TaxID=41899 RepID=UPI0006D8D686|nr:PQQ-binding-like beta-propeller repeat protein [Burkholderia plantarii]ALK30858.1 quinonprotein alcohol dehydrogenase [Burkholderia plantarii]GLZ23098.1 hypothetical protein Bpla01_66270 [Burkholderia plantarii]
MNQSTRPTDAAHEISRATMAVRENPDWETLRRQIYTRAIHFTDGLQFDFRDLLSDARYIEMAGQLMWRLVKPFEPTVLIGPGFGAAPLLFSTALAALRDGRRLHTLMVRDQRKEHNRKRWVEGAAAAPGSRAVIIDDFMKQGSAVALVDDALAADGHALDIRGAALLFDMWQPLGSRQLSLRRFPVVSLFRRHDIGLSRDCFDARPPRMQGSFPPFVTTPLWHRFELNVQQRHAWKSSPAIADGAVFVADDSSRVWRHNAADGAIQWCYESLTRPAKGIVQRLQFAQQSVIFGCYDGTITRLDARDGSIIWRWRQDSSVHATPVLDLEHDRLFVNTEQWNEGKPYGHLQALDWKTGRQIWSFRHSYWPPATVAHDAELDLVIAPCNDGTVHCVDAGDGQLRWTVRSRGLVRGRPGICSGRVIWATERGELECFDIRTGESLWTRRYGQPLANQFLLVRAGVVYVLDGTWHLLAFDTATGALRWLSRLRAPGCGCPIEYGSHLVVLSSEGQLAVFDPDREIKIWEGQIGGRYRQPPAVSAGLLAAASNDDGLKVFQISLHYEESR